MKISLTDASSGCSAEVSDFGARVLSWRCQNRERIFLPASAVEDERAAPHGGIPVLFPQFGFFGPGTKHGVVRDRLWDIEARGPQFVLLALKLDEGEHVPAAALKLRVTLESCALTVRFSITNTGAEAIRFTHGLHTYLNVQDVTRVRLQGLEGTSWLDALQALQIQSPSGAPLEAPVNVDRVYTAAPARLVLTDEDTQLVVEQAGFADTVVWNPGPDLATGLKDLAADEWRRFLCVEAAQISPPVELPAGETWYGHQKLQVVSA